MLNVDTYMSHKYVWQVLYAYAFTVYYAIKYNEITLAKGGFYC